MPPASAPAAAPPPPRRRPAPLPQAQADDEHGGAGIGGGAGRFIKGARCSSGGEGRQESGGSAELGTKGVTGWWGRGVGGLCVEEGDVEVLALPRGLCVAQRSENPHGRVHAREEVRHGHTHLPRAHESQPVAAAPSLLVGSLRGATFCGSPSGSPVTLIRPPMACTTMSYPARSLPATSVIERAHAHGALTCEVQSDRSR